MPYFPWPLEVWGNALSQRETPSQKRAHTEATRRKSWGFSQPSTPPGASLRTGVPSRSTASMVRLKLWLRQMDPVDIMRVGTHVHQDFARRCPIQIIANRLICKWVVSMSLGFPCFKPKGTLKQQHSPFRIAGQKVAGSNKSKTPIRKK